MNSSNVLFELISFINNESKNRIFENISSTIKTCIVTMVIFRYQDPILYRFLLERYLLLLLLWLKLHCIDMILICDKNFHCFRLVINDISIVKMRSNKWFEDRFGNLFCSFLIMPIPWSNFKHFSFNWYSKFSF